MKKIVFLAAVVAMVAALAGPASAVGGLQVGVFTGTATVSPGLVLPAAPKSAPVAGTWNLSTVVTGIFPLGTQALTANGKLSPVLGIGAACGISHGHSGTGFLGATPLSNLGWTVSLGGTLPVTGTWGTGVNSGPIVAVVQAQGGAACATGGATTFQVAGVAATL